MAIRIFSSRVLLDGHLQAATLELDGGIVSAIEPAGRKATAAHDGAAIIDLGSQEVCPTPIDLHLHGAGGVTVAPAGGALDLDRAIARVMQAGATWEVPANSLPEQLACELARRTPTPITYLATLPVPTRPPADIADHVAAAAVSIASAGPGSTACAGLRIEGLFLNPQRRGAWPIDALHQPDIALLDEIIAACAEAGTPLRVLDVAPELAGATELIEHAVAAGVVVSVAHSDATWAEAVAGFDAGATLATHTFNAMRPIHHREPGLVAAALCDARVTCELICDGVHVHPGAIALAVRAAGVGRVAAISDASPLAGLEPGTYEWAGMEVRSDGRMLADSSGALAGSARLLDAAASTLASAGLDRSAQLVTIAAAAHRVLDPLRPAGLVPGDRPWLPPPAQVDCSHG